MMLDDMGLVKKGMLNVYTKDSDLHFRCKSYT